MHYIILCRSLTQAQKAARALQREGIFSSVTKAPQSANPRGCTYGVKLGERNLSRGRAVLEKSGFEIGGLFSVDARGRVQEVTA